MSGWSSSMARSKAAGLSCTGLGFMKISVEAAHTITRRSQPFSALNRRMSRRSCSARSRLLAPVLTFEPSSFFT